ncbi:fatty acid metabolism transcriptional regulator FadR [Aggregatibacter actinomycetemcomitans]|uniref:fatty acid metabolism transcriptional regulator FadR n=1 Tax=Aggregatibacter actinomycetemcomitans TaxID=714 RepID=UPI0011D6DE99|nr:fatty acid metabolism transcriptional regulator FadR [Aggregatibacter actinomycetemcomitans]TYA51358.1 fatty acid metabolism transcriptional regulator FadR [Aggregatibacter actinomycetemcomitans]TYB29544.1 fatty acid metabolism transcriptional regulator FadR [Aggregatibacter actinomycetemcomitans]
MNNNSPLLKAQSPAALAEEYIVKSIWNNHFPPGSDLPAERELADKIGVTRTTLREVLQRLARDGWLNIQHGKPTKVNDIWETSGLNILETMIQLDGSRLPSLIANMRSSRTDISMIYIPKAFKRAPERSLHILHPMDNLEDTAEDYTKFDYDVFRNLAFASDNPVYGLILNSFKSLYTRIGLFYFQSAEARELAKRFYFNLRDICQRQSIEEVAPCILQYGKESSAQWTKMQEFLPKDFSEYT